MSMTNNGSINWREIVWILLLIISISGNIYLLTKKSGPTTFDESGYKKSIDSMNLIIQNMRDKNDSLNEDNQDRLEKIGQLKNDLKQLNKTSKYYEELYKKTIRSIDSMSDNDITRLFTDKFK